MSGPDEVQVMRATDLEIVVRPDPPVVAPAPLRAPAVVAPAVDLLTAVERLRMQIATSTLTLDVPDVVFARRERENLLSQLDDYLLPRLRRPDAPALAVIGGSTGAGKSTLTNSLLRRVVSRSGVLRPTTRSPVLIHHPQDSGAFLSQRILPRLTRVTSEAPEPIQPIDPNAPRITGLRLVPHESLTPGMAIIDAPDIDSLVETNRDLAVQLLQAADLWIFVTTAARYADAMPWDLLVQAAERGVAVAVVLDRVPPESLLELRVHLATRLRDRGLGGAPMFVIPETEIVEGFLPEPLVAPLQLWLSRVAGDEHARGVVTERTLKGVLGSLPGRVDCLVRAADVQAVSWQRLHDDVTEVFAAAGPHLLAGLIDGSLLRGELLAHWQEYLAVGDFVRRLDGGQPTLGERISAILHRDTEEAQPLDVPVTESITSAIHSALHAATDEVLSRWRQYPFGAALLEARGPQVAASDLRAQLDRTVRDWRVAVSARTVAVVDEAGTTASDRRIDAQTAADVMFVVAVDERSDNLGPETVTESAPGVVRPTDLEGTVAAARRILAGFLGVEPVRSVAAEARTDLINRAVVMLETERRRLERLLESSESRTGRGAAVRVAAEHVEAAR